MAYNNYYPASYQAMQYYPQVPQVQQPQQNNTGLIWVQGEGAAKSYLVAPGNTVALFDNESQTIYIKSADASGMPSMRILDYTFRENAPQNTHILPSADFATKDDVVSIRADIEALKAKFEDMEGSKK